MMMRIERVETTSLSAGQRHGVIALCNLAYDEDLSPYLEWIGPGLHLLAYDDRTLVSHVMIVERALQQEGREPLRTGYVELVATHPGRQGQGLATALLRASEHDLDAFALGALSPSSEAFYARLGWERWRGPLFTRRDGVVESTPDEAVMIRRTPTTPEWLDPEAPLSVEWREGEVW